jgi:hypothetical protein
MAPPSKPIATGSRFGQLVVVRPLERRNYERYYECRCDCGAVTEVRQSHLRGGAQSCRACSVRTHGMRNAPEYSVWCNMRRRCADESNVGYADYGGRGIRVCAQWQASFETFYADMGPRPSDDHTIDRIDVNGNYEPSNCRWATDEEQRHNRRDNRLIEFNGHTLCVAVWAARTGLPSATIRTRIDRGWTVQRALTEPVHEEKRNKWQANL